MKKDGFVYKCRNRLGADEAFRLGIVDHVVPIESLMEKCESIAHEICLSAPLAVQKIKEVVLEGSVFNGRTLISH